MHPLEPYIQKDRFSVSPEGTIISHKADGESIEVGHHGNLRGNVIIRYWDKDANKAVAVQGGRVAWRLHHGYWPPEDMSIMMVNRDKGDFRRENLMLVPRGKERTAGVTVREEDAA